MSIAASADDWSSIRPSCRQRFCCGRREPRDMDRTTLAGLATTLAGLVGYVLGVVAPYPGRGFSLTGLMVGLTLMAVGDWSGGETETSTSLEQAGASNDDPGEGDPPRLDTADGAPLADGRGERPHRPSGRLDRSRPASGVARRRSRSWPARRATVPNSHSADDSRPRPSMESSGDPTPTDR
jgi:hypothetical protein